MNSTFVAGLGIAGLMSWIAYPSDATAGPQTAFFNTLNGSANIVPPVSAGDTVFLDSLVTSQTGALSQSVTFTVGSGVTGLTGQAAWAVTSVAGGGPRLVGVDVNLFDAVTNTLVANDTFVGLLGGFARSTLAAGIGPGTYRLEATGSGVSDSLLNIALGFTGTVPVPGSAGTGGVPAQGPTVGEPTAFFSTLNGSRIVTPAVGAGDTLYVDSLVTSETGPLSQSVTFTLDSGVDGLSAIAAWAVSAAGDVGPRLVGVDIQLFDAVTDTLLFNDTFVGLTGGFASSTFDGAIGPGTYRLVATGVGQRESSLDIALSFTGVPVVAAAPEPATVALTMLGLAAVRVFSRRRSEQTARRMPA